MPEQSSPEKLSPGAGDIPYAMRTTLGWGVIGNANLNKNGEENAHCCCNRLIL